MTKIGIEFELQILKSDSLELSDSIEKLLDALPQDVKVGYPSVFYDVHACCVELRTSKHDSAEDAVREMIELFDVCSEVAQGLGLMLAGGGLHPFSPMTGNRIVSDVRHARLAKERGDVWLNTTVFGQHVHVEPREPFWQTFNLLRRFIPLLIAYSANSPIVEGRQSGYSSSRLHFYNRVVSTGIPPNLNGKVDFKNWIKKNRDIGVLDERDIYWDIRPRLQFGTVEIRLFDSPLNWRTLHANAALAELLVGKSSKLDSQLIEQTESELIKNRLTAIRCGFESEFLIGNERVLAKDILFQVIENHLDLEECVSNEIAGVHKSTAIESVRSSVEALKLGYLSR